jgi:hypothetical protein
MSKCVECGSKLEQEMLCKDCATAQATAMYERGREESDLGDCILRYLTREVGHYPLTAADIVARPNLKLLEDALHA